MSIKPVCSQATKNQVVDLQREAPQYVPFYIKQLPCLLTDVPHKAYVNPLGELRPYPGGKIQDNTGTRPPGEKMITAAEWNALTKGQQMNPNEFTGIATVDIGDKQQLANMSQDLLNTANEIYDKIKTLENTNSNNFTQTQTHQDNLRKQLTYYQQVYNKLKSIDTSKSSTLGGILNDVKLQQTSSFYRYVIWLLLAIIGAIYAIRHIKNK